MLNSVRRLLLFLTAFSLSEGYLSLGSVAGVGLTPNKLVTALLLLFAMADLMARPRRFPRNRKNVWILAFATTSGISLIMSMLSGIAVSALLVYSTTFLAIFLFYGLLVHLTRNVRDLDTLLWGLCLGVAFTGASALVGIGKTDDLLEYQRVGGLGGNSNMQGLNAAVALPLMFILFRGTRNLIAKALLGGAATLAAVAIVGSISRGAAVAILLMSALWTIRFRRTDLLRYLIPAAVAGFVFVQLAPQQYFQRIGTISSEAATLGEGRTYRTAGYKEAVVAIVTHPVLGLGTAGFGPWAHQRNRFIPEEHFVHNSFLQVAVEQGLIGLIPFVMIVGLTWRDYNNARLARRRAHKERDPELERIEQRAVYLQIATIGILVGISFQPYMLQKTFWFLISTSSIVAHLTRERVARAVAAEGLPEPGPLHSPTPVFQFPVR